MKKTQMRSACEKWGQDMVREFASHLSCYPKLQKDLTLRLRLIQTGVLGNCRVAHQAPGWTAEAWLQKEPSFN